LPPDPDGGAATTPDPRVGASPTEWSVYPGPPDLHRLAAQRNEEREGGNLAPEWTTNTVRLATTRQEDVKRVHQRTTRVSLRKGLASDLVARLNADIARSMTRAPGFLANYVVEPDDTTMITTRNLEDVAWSRAGRSDRPRLTCRGRDGMARGRSPTPTGRREGPCLDPKNGAGSDVGDSVQPARPVRDQPRRTRTSTG